MTAAWMDVEDAVAVAKEAFGIETEYVNYYRCDDCDVEWKDIWTCGCDDECPNCGTDFSPYDSVEIDP